ncbi:unnamed protein product [Brassica oleracea]
MFERGDETTGTEPPSHHHRAVHTIINREPLETGHAIGAPDPPSRFKP